jgi:tetratricopeptide (TPR) repeat protein
MSSQRHHSSTWRSLVITVVLLFSGIGLPTAFGQNFDWKIGSGYHPPNPQSYVKHIAINRPNGHSKQTANNLPQPVASTSADDKQQDIEKAIADGNEARDKNSYEQALDHYRKAEALSPKEARAFYGMGNLYSDLSCYDSAIESYRNALDLKKDYLEALIGLGYAYISKERYDEAEKQFQTVHDLKSNNIEANLGLGRVYAKKGRYQEAVTQINSIINAPSTKNEDRAKAYFALGLIYGDQQKWQDATAQFEKAISFNPDFAVAYLQLGVDQTIVAFSKFGSLSLQEVRTQDMENLSTSARQAGDNIQRAIEHHFKHPVAYLYLGHALLYQSNYQGAETKYNMFLTEVKKLEDQLSAITKDIATKCDSGFSNLNANGYWSLGFMYEREGDLETDNQRKTDFFNEAIKQFEQAIKLKQDFAAAYGSLGMIYFVQGKYEEAIKQYKKELNYETKDSAKANAYTGLGFSYFNIGSDNEAIFSLNKAIELAPNDPTISAAYADLSLIYEKQGNIDEAIVQQKKAMEHELQATAHSYYFLASEYFLKARQKGIEEDYAEAIRLSKKAIEINNAYASAYFLLGRIYTFYKNGAMADEALANLEKASEYDPKNPDVYYAIADVYDSWKHNPDAAIQYLRKAIEVKPDYAKAYLYLGLVYDEKKDDAEAIKQLLKAIGLDPKYLDAHLWLASLYREGKNYPEAIKYLNKAIEIAPTDLRPYKELAKVNEAQGKNEDAIHYYEEALNRTDANDSATKNLYLGRIARLKGQYAEAIAFFQKVNFPNTPGQANYDIGVTYVLSKNRKAALEQHQQLVQLKSSLAEELLNKINEMK